MLMCPMEESFHFYKRPPEKCPSGNYILPRGVYLFRRLKQLINRAEICEMTSALTDEALEWQPDPIYGEYKKRPNYLEFMHKQCGRCALRCSVMVEVEGKTPTGNITFSYEEQPEDL